MLHEMHSHDSDNSLWGLLLYARERLTAELRIPFHQQNVFLRLTPQKI